MNQDGSFGIPHGEPQEEEDSVAVPTETDTQEDIESASETAANDLNISHESPIEEPATAEAVEDSEPVDIFASAEEQAAESAQAATPAPQPTTPTPSTPRSANNPFNSRNRFQAQNTQPASNVPQFFNDAIIANTPIEQPKSSKKGLFIGIGIGAVALIGIMLLVLSLVGKGGKGGGGEIVDINGTRINIASKPLFYKFANYTLYGKDSEAVISEVKDDDLYEYNKHIYASKEFDQNYAKDISNRYNSFYDKFYSDNPNTTTSFLDSKIKHYKTLLDFIALNPSSEELSHDHIMEIYVNQGKEAANKEAEKVLKPFNDESNEFASEFYNLKKADFESSILFMDKIKAAGCISGGTVNEACFNKTRALNSDGSDLKEEIGQYDADAYNLVADDYRHIGLDCWEIKDAFEGEGK